MSGGADPLALFGTDEPIPQRRLVEAGPLSVILENGNLRTISFAGVEVVRAVNYLARDSSWGTYDAVLSNMEIVEAADAFSIAYDGLCTGEARYAYRMTIKGDASGRLTLEAVGEALADFPTNRTGFVVLHPAEAAGGTLSIRHSDGQVEETIFPEEISADQPAFDISALTHQPAPGLTCTVEMEGDAFEMEDQRNWADASFKTYVRPLSKPRPYLIAKGERDIQRVSIAVEGRQPRRAATSSDSATLTLAGPEGRMPSMALFLDLDDLGPAIANAGASGGAQTVVFRFDPAKGHDSTGLVLAANFAATIGASLAVEAIFEARDPAEEARHFVRSIQAAKFEPGAVLVSPRREFKTRPSGTLPSSEQSIGEIVGALRSSDLTARIGAGTPSFFTEFNRNPPGTEADFVFFSIGSNVHAADDASIMETVGVYPAIIASAWKLCPGKPIWLGPCTIGMRHNPYGATVAANPGGTRKPAAGIDPRHGALFGAAFATGVAAMAAAAGVNHLTLAAPTGPFGLLDDDGTPRPLQSVHAILTAAAGLERHRVGIDRPDVAAVAFRAGSMIRVLAANLGTVPVALRLPAVTSSVEMIGTHGRLEAILPRDVIVVEPYRTVCLTIAEEP